MKGIVRFYNDAKGYGFIMVEGQTGPIDVWVHYSSIVTDGFQTLTEGQEVTFDFKQGPKGLEAINVVKQSTND